MERAIPHVTAVTVRSANGQRIEGLDVLRGLAAFAIVLFHMRVPLFVGWHVLTGNLEYSRVDRALAWLSPPMALFGTAVMLFFVVSGSRPSAPAEVPRDCESVLTL